MSSDVLVDAKKIVIIADDLSGAAEVAGIAFAHGLSAEVQRQFEPVTTAQVIAVDTDSRHMPAAEAANRLRDITDQVVASRPNWIFKKVDSLLRGNVVAEIEAMLLTTGHRRALLIPANPSRGRTIVGGQYFVNGRLLEKTQFADDADHPRTSSEIRNLLGDAGQQPRHIIDPNASLPADALIVPNVATPADLARLACLADSSTLLAGAADFFSALLEASPHPRSPTSDSRPLHADVIPPALLVCGSRISWPARRADCVAAKVPLIALDAGGGESSRDFGALAVGIGERRLTASASDLLSFLSQLVAFMVGNSTVKTLLIEGGATAAAIAEHFRWTRFAVESSAPAGVGVLRPHGAHAPLVLIKPGSYPWPPEIWQEFCACNTHQPEA